VTIAEIFPAASSESISEANSEISPLKEMYEFLVGMLHAAKRGAPHQPWTIPCDEGRWRSNVIRP
jgi:hypothetical protein